MSDANCFIILPTTRAMSPPGELVDVQILDGLL